MSAQLDFLAYALELTKALPRPIKNDSENEALTAQLQRLSALEKPTLEQQTVADLLVGLIEAYEERFALPEASALEVLHELMAANNFEQKDMVPEIASKGTFSEVYRGIRPISKGIARKLGMRFGVPHTLFL